MYVFPVEILLIILSKYPLKQARLICSTLTNEFQNKYWHQMIINQSDITKYINQNNYFFKDYRTYIFSNYQVVYDKYIRNTNIMWNTNDKKIDLISQYNILSDRFNDQKYKNIIKNKNLNHLKSKHLGLYSDSLDVFSIMYLWLITHCYVALKIDIDEHIHDYNIVRYNFNDVITIIKILRPKAKVLYNILYDYINSL